METSWSSVLSACSVVSDGEVADDWEEPRWRERAKKLFAYPAMKLGL